MKNIVLLAFLSLLHSWVIAQSPNALGSRNVQDYFQDVESKSYYQQERIRSMKGEMNEYSERLHGLQEKFHKIFYGNPTDEIHQTPFGSKEKISYPKRKYREPVPIEEVHSIARRPSSKSSNEKRSNQLAFSVDQSKATSEKEVESQEEPLVLPLAEEKNIVQEVKRESFSNVSRFGGYLILRPGVAIPYKTKNSHYGVSGTKHRKYDPGLALTLSGGYRWNGWKFGGGVLYRKNDHDSKSYEKNGAITHPFANGSDSTTIAGFFESGYTHSFNQWVGLYGLLGLGYGVSIVEDFAPLFSGGVDRSRLDPFFFASAGFGVTWTPTEFFALSLGYRYLHEREVPAHSLEIGLEGKF